MRWENTLLKANTPSLSLSLMSMCDCDNVWIECWKRCKEKNLKCENWSVEERQGQINFYLIWPRLYSNFISHFFLFRCFAIEWARAHTPLRMGIGWMLGVCLRHETEFFCGTFHTLNKIIFFFFGGIRKRNERCGFSTEVKHDELFDWIYLFRAKSIYADFFLGELP